jgi:molybdate transport system regulatory protein
MNVDDRDALGFGRGIVTLLDGIEKNGSIYQSTRDMGMAYSKAWKIINQTEEEFGFPLIHREGPHGSKLTEEAKVLISHYKEMAEAAQKAADAVFKKYYA